MAIDFTFALEEAVRRSGSPGAVAYVGNITDDIFFGAHGYRQIKPQQFPVEKNTPYDLASLTKVVATTSTVLLLHQEGQIDFDAPVSTYLPIPAFKAFTVRQCLTHTAGLIPGRNYYETCSSIEEMLQRYGKVEPSSPPGVTRRYSDVGFMILGRVVELVAREPLDRFCVRRIFQPLGMSKTCFRPPSEWADSCAATEVSSVRPFRGVVHDPNAYAVGGVSGHAGLFSTAGDLATFCRALMSGKIVSKETLDKALQPGQVPTYPWQGLGWKVDPWSCSVEGYLPSRSAIGHTGWTGTSIWMDRDTGNFVILLSNTCHPSANNRDNTTLRRVFHTAVSRALYTKKLNTHSGLDRVVWENFEAVKGKKLAVLTNNAAVDQLGRHILDVLALEPTAKVRFIYCPEHGLRGNVEAGKKVASERAATPIISLYGDRKAPSKEELAQVKLFVVDLQDVGARWYTYMATMLDCLRACAEAGCPVLVLDRPNPVGGALLEGPLPEQLGGPTCCAPIPARHGMTMGELAQFFQRTALQDLKLDLTVSALDAWKPDLLFHQCSLPWVPPSPNIPTPKTPFVYLGTCLFEGTNLNEGRGTDEPFFVFGAPWLDSAAVVKDVEPEAVTGFKLSAIEYTPRSIPGKAEEPRYKGETCRGVRVAIQDFDVARPFLLGVALLCAVRARHPAEYQWSTSFDNLGGSPWVREAIDRGDKATDIVARFTAGLGAFDAIRPRLYPPELPEDM